MLIKGTAKFDCELSVDLFPPIFLTWNSGSPGDKPEFWGTMKAAISRCGFSYYWNLPCPVSNATYFIPGCTIWRRKWKFWCRSWSATTALLRGQLNVHTSPLSSVSGEKHDIDINPLFFGVCSLGPVASAAVLEPRPSTMWPASLPPRTLPTALNHVCHSSTTMTHGGDLPSLGLTVARALVEEEEADVNNQ